MAVTLRDVASRVGVSSGVASTVLSGKKSSIGVSLATQLKVREAARELGYAPPKRDTADVRDVRHPRRTTKSANPGVPVAAGVVVIVCAFSHDDDFWQRYTLNALEKVVADNETVSRFVNLYRAGGEQVPLSVAVGELLADDSVQAVVIVDLHDIVGTETINRALAPLILSRIPMVCITNSELSVAVPNVIHDQFATGTLAVSHLLERGGGVPVHFFAPFDLPWEAARIAGVRAGVKVAGFDESAVQVWSEKQRPDPAKLITPDDWEAHFAASARRFVAERLLGARRDEAPLSVIAASDRAAHDCVAFATDAGLRQRSDYLIVGFDDAPQSRLIGLTSLHPPLQEMGEEAGRLLIRLLAGERTNPQLRLRSRVIARDSTVRTAD